MNFGIKLKYIYSVLLVVVLIALQFMPVYAETANQDVLSVNADGYECYAESSAASLYADKNGHFILKNNVSGKVWSSIPQNYKEDKVSAGLTRTDIRSELIIEYFFRSDENKNVTSQKSNSYVMSESKDGIEVSKVTDGFKVLYRMEEIDMEIPVIYTLNGNELEVSIDLKGFREGSLCYLISLALLPYFGAVDQNTDGYLFVPDGCGAVSEFNKNMLTVNKYEKTIYGDDMVSEQDSVLTKEKKISIPVFGLFHDDSNGLMATVTSGDGSAAICAQTVGPGINYNAVSSKLIYRLFLKSKSFYSTKKSDTIYTVSHTDFGVDKYTVSYTLLSGQDADYNGMAASYRKRLEEDYKLKKQENQLKLALRAYGCYEEKKSFLGFAYYKKQSLTSFEQTISILNDLKASGCENIAVQYVGWSGNGAINRVLPQKVTPLSVLGGKKQFNNLIDYTSDNGIELYPNFDLLRLKKSGNGVSLKKNTAKAYSGDNIKLYHYSLATGEKSKSIPVDYLLNFKFLSKFANKLVSNYSKTDINTISLSTLGSYLYSDLKKSGGTYRSENENLIVQTLKSVKDKGYSISLDEANAYTFPYISRTFEAPAASSGYDFFTYDVPFYQMVLSGYATYTTESMVQSVDYNKMFLKALETGSDPLFETIYEDSNILRETELSELYSSSYRFWENRAKKSYKGIEAFNSAVKGSCILRHERIADDVYCTTYENGAKVYVNYSDSDFGWNDISVPGLGYLIKEA